MERTTRPNKRIAFTVERPEQVERLPYYYLCGLAAQTGFMFPHLTTREWFVGPLSVI